jgi:hypothetical protein
MGIARQGRGMVGLMFLGITAQAAAPPPESVPEAPAGSGYSIDWFTQDAGGGSSSGAGYSVAGTFGQADAGEASGSGLNLNGGFWFTGPNDLIFRNGFD